MPDKERNSVALNPAARWRSSHDVTARKNVSRPATEIHRGKHTENLVGLFCSQTDPPRTPLDVKRVVVSNSPCCHKYQIYNRFQE